MTDKKKGSTVDILNFSIVSGYIKDIDSILEQTNTNSVSETRAGFKRVKKTHEKLKEQLRKGDVM